MAKVQVNKEIADIIEKLRSLPFYSNQEDTDGAIIEAHAEKDSSWGHPLDEVSVGKLARALILGYEVVVY